MAGSKTRFGFLGGGDEPPDSGESGAARTIIGHDIHLPKLPTGFEQPRPLASPTPMAPTPIPPARIPYTPVRPAAVVAPMPEVITESVPVRRKYRPQKSRLARFLGRWSTGGQFHPRSSKGQATLLDEPDDGDLEVPREVTGRNVLLVLGIAVLTFLVTFAIVRIRQRYATAQPAPVAHVGDNPTAAPPAPALAVPAMPTLPTAPAPVATPPAPSVPAPPAPAEKPALLGTPAVSPPGPPRPLAKATTPTQLPLDQPTRPHPRKPTRAAPPTGQPPEHLKGELLPLSP